MAVVGRDTLLTLAPVLGQNWRYHPVPLFATVNLVPKYVTFELGLHAIFVAGEIWGGMPELVVQN